MVTKHLQIESESDFRTYADEAYRLTKECIENNELPKFKNLLEIASSDVSIHLAIEKLEKNQGSDTPGVDGITLRNILERDYKDVMDMVHQMFKQYEPDLVRRVEIPKPGKSEKRPLGIPAMADRIIQQCIKQTLEPIMEAQFFKHSYGFRPMRSAHHAMERIKYLGYNTQYNWVVEGDIKGFFDNVNHRILLKRLWHMGIRDQRLLMIIKAMLKSGVMKDGLVFGTVTGTPQGGIISPLLANVYLHAMDEWVTREWENKKTKYEYSSDRNRFQSLNRTTNLKPAYLVRYADDWVLFTNSRENAEKWKFRISQYLEKRLKLTLSKEKTLITNIRKRPINFLGFKYSLYYTGKNKHKPYQFKTTIDEKRLEPKMKELAKKIHNIRRTKLQDKNSLINEINRVNSAIRGYIEYYKISPKVYLTFRKYAHRMTYTAYKSLKRYGGEWVRANETINLPSVHPNYTTKIPSIHVTDDVYVGITDLSFSKWELVTMKNQDETPYTPEGRAKYQKRTEKKSPMMKSESFLKGNLSYLIATGQTKGIYNFEYFYRRARVFANDKGKCRVCSQLVISSDDVHFHHRKPWLPMNLVNKSKNLITVHTKCHNMIHSELVYTVGKATWNRILKFREELKRPAK